MIRLPMFKRKQVVTTLKNDLGNQMLQYAAARNLADKTGRALASDLAASSPATPSSRRKSGTPARPITRTLPPNAGYASDTVCNDDATKPTFC